jgi:hypothetical protein
MTPEPLHLRRVERDREAFRVVWRGIEVGSIGLQVGAAQRTFWHWGLDAVGSFEFATRGDTILRDQAMTLFRQAWDEFTADPDRLQRFVETVMRTSAMWVPRIAYCRAAPATQIAFCFCSGGRRDVHQSGPGAWLNARPFLPGKTSRTSKLGRRDRACRLTPKKTVGIRGDSTAIGGGRRAGGR